MKHYSRFLCLMMLLPWVAKSQKSTADFAVQVSATVSENPASIRLAWPSAADAGSWTVWRKAVSQLYWGKSIASLSASDTAYTDTAVKVGTGYEYRIIKNVSGNSYKGYGYIYSGIKLPAVDYRGRVLLLVADSLLPDLKPEIDRLVMDLRMDGWTVTRRVVAEKAAVEDVKGIIINEYRKDRKGTKAVFLLGHVPVPYSGNFAIDGHPEHQGAWPADVFYGDIDGDWSDFIVDNTGGYDKRIYNEPGDGKYDQDVLPSDMELQVGRVDFKNMPLFIEGEKGLMRRYLNKDHAWRLAMIQAEQRGLVQDNFGIMSGEAFAASGYKNFAPMFGANKVDTKPYSTLTSQSYVWSYGTGPGDFTDASGIVSSSSYVKDSFQTVFTMLFGSWFGDWDSPNNLLRAAIANRGPVLTAAWSGRPHWSFQHMAMGETTGYDAWTTQNNYTSYWRSTFLDSTQRVVSPDLMGDPCLRMHIVQPASALKLDRNDYFHVHLAWTKSPDANVIGYNIYRSPSLDSMFVRINTSPVSSAEFSDPNPGNNGMNYYMVRAVKLQESASGTYYNMSQGIMDSIETRFTSVAAAHPQLELQVFPNPSKSLCQLVIPVDVASGTLKVMDMRGGLVYTRALKSVRSGETMNLDLNGLAKGTYIIQVYGGGNKLSRKWIKE